MTTLVIKDLPLITNLDRTAMSCVHGGFFFGLVGPIANYLERQRQADLDTLLTY